MAKQTPKQIHVTQNPARGHATRRYAGGPAVCLDPLRRHLPVVQFGHRGDDGGPGAGSALPRVDPYGVGGIAMIPADL